MGGSSPHPPTFGNPACKNVLDQGRERTALFVYNSSIEVERKVKVNNGGLNPCVEKSGQCLEVIILL